MTNYIPASALKQRPTFALSKIPVSVPPGCKSWRPERHSRLTSPHDFEATQTTTSLAAGTPASENALAARDRVVADHLHLVKATVSEIRKKLPVEAHVDHLTHAGMAGLMAAADTYDSGKDAFPSRARHQIRGAILDKLNQLECAATAVKDPKTVAAQRLDVLALARALKNVSLACKQAGISRSRFYEIKDAFDKHGMDGLTPQLRRTPIMPHQTPPEVVELILSMTASYPTYSYVRISDKLRANGCPACPSTVRGVWKKQGLKACSERLLWLQKRDGSLPDRYMRRLSKAKAGGPGRPTGNAAFLHYSLISQPLQASAS